MKNFYSLVQTRRSTRTYSTQSIPQELIQQLQEVALMSPASKRSNSWEFIFIDDKKLLEALSVSKPSSISFIKDAPLAIVVLADTSKSDVWIENASIASIYLQLAAEDLNLGSCWVQIRGRNHNDSTTASDYIKELLHVPAQFEVLSIISVGYKLENRPQFDLSRLQKDKLHTNIYNTKK